MTPEQTFDKASPFTELREALHKALSNPLRHRILIVLDERVASPKELSEELDEPLETVAYHVRYLAGKTPASDEPLIELVDTDRRRGGTQHFYKAIVRPIVDIPEADRTPRIVREDSTAAIVPRVKRDIDRALAGGTFDSHPARSLLRMLIDADDEGIVESGEASMRYLAELREIEARSVTRSPDPRNRRRMATATLVYEVPPED
jgi:DNA-binding transcriptional ArsR family regulator